MIKSIKSLWRSLVLDHGYKPCVEKVLGVSRLHPISKVQPTLEGLAWLGLLSCLSTKDSLSSSLAFVYSEHVYLWVRLPEDRRNGGRKEKRKKALAFFKVGYPETTLVGFCDLQSILVSDW